MVELLKFNLCIVITSTEKYTYRPKHYLYQPAHIFMNAVKVGMSHGA